MGEVNRKDWREMFGMGISQREWRGILARNGYFETVVMFKCWKNEGRRKARERKAKANRRTRKAPLDRHG